MSRPCSSQVYQDTPTPASVATSFVSVQGSCACHPRPCRRRRVRAEPGVTQEVAELLTRWCSAAVMPHVRQWYEGVVGGVTPWITMHDSWPVSRVGRFRIEQWRLRRRG